MENFKLERKIFFSWKNILVLVLVSFLISSLNFIDNYRNKEYAYKNYLTEVRSYKNKLVGARKAESFRKDIDVLCDKIYKIGQLFSSNKKKEGVDALIDFYKSKEIREKDFIRVVMELPEKKIEERLNFLYALKANNLGLEGDVYSLVATNHVKSLIDKFQSPYFFILILLILAKDFTKDYEGGNFMLRKTIPCSRFSYFASKIIGGVGFFIFGLGLICLFSTLLCLVFGQGLGSLYYPIVLKTESGMRMVTISLYLAKAIGYLSLYALVSFSLFMLIVIFLKEIMISASLLSILLLAMSKPSSNIFYLVYKEKMTWFFPFKYLNFVNMITDRRLNFILPLIISLVFFYLISYLLTKLEDLSLVQSAFAQKRVKDIGKSLKDYEKSKFLLSPYLFFEVKKLTKPKSTYLTIGIVLIATIIFNLSQISAYHKSLGSFKMILELNKRHLVESLQDEASNGIKKDETRAYIDIFDKTIQSINKGEVSMINTGLDKLTKLERRQPGNYGIGLTSSQIDIHDALFKETLARKGLSPIFSIVSLEETPFDRERDFFEELSYKKHSESHQLSRDFILNKLFKKNISLVMIGILVFSLAKGLGLERGEGQPIKFMNTQPVKTWGLITSKLLAQVLVIMLSAGLIFFSFSLSLALLGLPYSYNTPSVHYKMGKDDGASLELKRTNMMIKHLSMEKEEDEIVTISFNDIRNDNIKLLALTFFSLVFVSLLAYLLSIYVKNANLVSILVLTVMALAYGLSGFIMTKLDFILPFIWFRHSTIIDGTENILRGQRLYNFTNGSMILIIWSIILFVLSFISYKKVFRR